MHDVAAFLVRRDHRLAREIHDLIDVETTDLDVDLHGRPRLAQLRFALDAALTDWLEDESPARAVTTAARAVPRSATTASVAARGRFGAKQRRP